ncbi:MAG: hypothetical protein K0U37_09515 [Gammaproteobacteria bacterium]|nr:hypothetical protein [Gammaproteobacteria bacterium]
MTAFKRKEDAQATLDKMIGDAQKALLGDGADAKIVEAKAKFEADNVAALEALEAAAVKTFEAAKKDAGDKAGDVKKEEVTDEQKTEATAGVLSAMTKAFTPANALFAFEYRVKAALEALPADDKDLTEEKVAEFKKAFNAANLELVQGFKNEGKPSAVEYLKDFGMKLLGALLAIVMSPALAVNYGNSRSFVGSFFNGAHTEASRKAQENEADAEKFVTAAPAA